MHHNSLSRPFGLGTKLCLWTLLAVELIFLIQWGWSQRLITYRRDFGETFVAYEQARHMETTFHRFGMLHVEVDPAGEEKIYTHNVNIGTQYFALLRLFGITTLAGQTLFVLPVFLSGLLLAFRAVAFVTRSTNIALVFLGLMVLDFANVGAFAFNALRAWHYVALFSCIYGIQILIQDQLGRGRGRGLAYLLTGAIISFGCGYDFFVIVGMITVLQVASCNEWRSGFRALAGIGGCFALPFLLRQLEIIYWLGLRTWSIDFRTTFAIKVPFASRFISIPSMAEIDRLYARAHLLRPPSYPTGDWSGIWRTFAPLMRLEVVPDYGLLGCALVVACSLFAVISAVTRMGRGQVAVGSRLVGTYFVGAAAGLLVFAPFSLHVYLKHDFPLVAALIHLAEAVCITAGFEAAFTQMKAHAYYAAIGSAAAGIFLILNAGIVQWYDHRSSKELDLNWSVLSPELAAEANAMHATIAAAVSLPPESPAALAIPPELTVIPPDEAPWLLAQSAHLLVDEPLFMPAHLSEPDLALIYSPGDGWCNLDAREPDLSHQDWLLKGWTRWRERNLPPVALTNLVLYAFIAPKAPISPHDIVHLKFLALLPPRLLYESFAPELQVTDSHGVTHQFENLLQRVHEGKKGGEVSLLYNPRFQTLDVYFRAPRQFTDPGSTKLSFTAVLHSSLGTITSIPVIVAFSPDATPVRTTPMLPEPTTGDMLAAFHQQQVLSVSHRGVGYCVLKLEPARQNDLPSSAY